jgi:platelet-activating factor acetylhydrolase
MPSLPEPTGPYTVAATSFVRPVPREQRPVIGSARVRADRHTTTPDGPLEPALSIEEFAFTIFYPAEVPNKRSSWFSNGRHGLNKGMDWFVHPIAESIRGYEHFAGEYDARTGRG